MTAKSAFDDTVTAIEMCVLRKANAVSILQSSVDTCRDAKTRAACDFRFLREGHQRTGDAIGEEDRLEDEIYRLGRPSPWISERQLRRISHSDTECCASRGATPRMCRRVAPVA